MKNGRVGIGLGGENEKKDGGYLSTLLSLGDLPWLSCYIKFYIKVRDSTTPRVTEFPHSV